MANLAAIFKISADITDLQTKMAQGVASIDSMERNTSKMSEAMATAGRVMAGAFSVTAIIGAGKAMLGFAKDAADAAGATLDLAGKTGLSTETIQRMGFVANQTQGSVESFARAAFMLGVNLEKGTGQVKGLGYSFEELQRLSPDEQFRTVVSALEDMEDPQERNRVAVELFGKAAQDILPAIAEGYSQIAAKAEVSGQKQLEALDKAGDAWDAFVTNSKAKVASWLGTQVMMTEQMGRLNLQQRIRLNELERAGLSTQDALAKIFPPNVHLAAEKVTSGVKDVEFTLTNLGGVVIPPTKAALRQIADEATKAAKAMEAFGAAVTAKATAALREMWASGVLQNINASLREQRQELILMLPLEYDWAAANEKTTATLHDMVNAGALHKQWTQEEIKEVTTITEKTTTWRDSLTSLAQAMTNLAQTSKSTLVSALATVANGIDVGIKGVEGFTAGFKKLTSGSGLTSILSGFTGMVSGIGGVVAAAQAAIQIGKALFNLFDRDKGRDMVEEFAKSFGGFDALHELLNQLGAEGERLWIMLTQGVGRNNREQALAAIEEVRKALERLRASAGDISVTYHGPDIGVENTDTENSFAGGSGGIRDFGSGTLAMLHGREGVFTESQVAGMGGGTTVVHTHVHLDGREVAESVTRYQDSRYRHRQLVGAV